MKKRILSLITILTMIAALIVLPTTAFAESSGTCGDNLTWVLIDGVLTISGTGSMEDYNSSSPWHSVTDVVIENGVTSIGDYAFCYCNRLTNIEIPNSVTSIGHRAFYKCTSLTNIEIPNSITRISDYAFYGCNSLNIIVDENNNYYSDIDGVLFNKKGTTIILYAKDKIAHNYKIPNSVTSIGKSAFSGCEHLSGVEIPNSITSIGDYAFSNCKILKSIKIPSSVISIGESAFHNCGQLTSIEIPNSVISIGHRAFRYCGKLTDVYFDGSEEDWNDITIGGYNSCLTSATIHYNSTISSDIDETPPPTVTEAPTEQHTLTADFYMTDEDNKDLEYITYDADKNTYSADSFLLGGDLCDTTWGLSSNAQNVEVTVTLPEGFSFEYSLFPFDSSLEKRQKTYSYDTFGYKQYISEKVYVQNPSVGDYTVGIHISGDNVTETELEFTIPINQYIFEVNKYRADYLIDTSEDTEAFIDMLESSPSHIIVENESTAFGVMADLWSLMNDSVSLVLNPSKELTYAFEDKDMYEAIILDIFECSSNNTSYVKNLDSLIDNHGKKLFNLVCEDLENAGYYDFLSGVSYEALSLEEAAAAKEAMKECTKVLYPKYSTTVKISDAIDTFFDVCKDIEQCANAVTSYIELYSMEDSMKHVLQQMYQSCPWTDTALKGALLECITVMNSSEEGLLASLAAEITFTAGKGVARTGITAVWSGIKNLVMLNNPEAYAILIAYKTGVFLSNALSNVDNITEAFFKCQATDEIVNLVDSAYLSLRYKYKAEPTEDNAKDYLSSIEIMFNALDASCDSGIAYMDTILSSNVRKWFTDTSSIEEIKSEFQSSQKYYYKKNESISVSWINTLLENYPNEYENYYQLISESLERVKSYNIQCPVDVYVYDSSNNLVASAVGSDVYAADDANLLIYNDGKDKTLYLYDDEEYNISYIGSGSGSMDITVTEYDEYDQTERTVYFDDLPLQKGTEYSSTDNGEVETYSIEGEDGTIYADYDSSTSDEIDPHLIETINEVLTNSDTPANDDTQTSYGSTISSWAKEEMEEAYAEELVPENLIGEDLTKPVTRDEFAAIAVALYENLSGDIAEGTNNPFCDIYNSDYKSDILKAYNLNITAGADEYTFEPDTLISREQVATMLTRAYKRSEFDGWSLDNDSQYNLNSIGTQKFADDDEISDYAKESVYFMVKWGVINGVGDNKFAPNGNVTLEEGYGYATREEALAVALRSAKYL